MGRLSKRELERLLDSAEPEEVEPNSVLPVFTYADDTYTIDPETLEVDEEPRSDLSSAAVIDAIERGEASGITVFTRETVEDFEQRLKNATDTLESDGGPELEPADVASFIVGRWTDEIPSGEAGVVEHFGENVEVADVDRVRAHVLETADR